MPDSHPLGPFVRRFLPENVFADRNLSLPSWPGSGWNLCLESSRRCGHKSRHVFIRIAGRVVLVLGRSVP